MTRTMRILTLLLLTMVGAGQMWAETDEPSNIKRCTISGGSIAFYADEACTSNFEGDVEANATVYVKATAEPGKTAIGVTFTVKKSIGSDAMQAPSRRGSEGPGVTSDITVSAVDGKPGIYSFVMPADGNTNVSVSATFAAPQQEQVSYVDGNGQSQTVNAYVLDETMQGLSTGFYVVPDGGITFSHLTIADDANLILRDGATLTVDGTIEASDNHSLTIYAQTAMTGQLTVATYACGVILVPHFVAYSGDYATALVAAGTVSDANKTTINGKTLKPLVGNAFTKYVPQDKAGNYTITLPALPEDAAYSFTKTDEGGIIASHSYDAEHNTLTVATNSGKTSGTNATITVEAADAPNYNDYSFKVNVIVSEYTTVYAWPEQTNIWLDADNELVWAEGGNTLDTSLLTVKKNGAAVTNYTAKVGETVLGSGENTLTLEPGAYRINIIGDDGKLDDWVDFKVIQLTENGQDFSVTFNDFTIPVRTEDGYEAGLVATAGELAYGEYTKSITRSEVVAGDPIVDGNLKVWFDYKDRFSGVPSFSRWIQLDHIYNYKEQYRRKFTRFGEIVPVGNYHTVYMPNGTNFNVLYDAFGEPVPADDKGGKIYYMSGFHPNLHTEKTEREVEGKTVTEWVLYDGDTKVEDGYYFRDKNDIYYGDGVNKFKNVSSGDSDELLTLYPIYFFEQDANALDKEGRWRDGDGIVQRITGYEAFGWDSNEGCAIVGGDYIYIGQLIYLGYAYPGVKPTIDGSIIRIGDEYYDVGEGSPIAYLPNDMIGQFNPPLTLNKWSSAYAKYRVDDYTYQVASRDFFIYPNNSLITVTNNKGTYHVGEKIELEFTVKSLRDGGLYVFLNGDLYHHFENVGTDELVNSVTLSLNDLSAGKYTITAISDQDHYVTGFETNTFFTVVRTDPVLTLTGKQNTAGEAFETDAEIEYDPENPIVVNAVNDKAVSGTFWKWQISNTSDAGVVEIDHTVNESEENEPNSEDVYLNTIGLGTVKLWAGFSGNNLYNPATGAITFTVVPKNVTSPIIELVDQSTIYYDGTAKEPAVKVYYAEGKEIPADQYDVTYANNTNGSTEDAKAKIIVKSKTGALYTIDAEKEFEIQATTLFAANSTNLWATFCSQNEYEVPEGCTAYTIGSISGSTVTLSDALTSIPAYTPVLIQRDANVTLPVTAIYKATGAAPASGYDAQTGLAWTPGTAFTFYGNCLSSDVSADDFKDYYNEGQTYLLFDGKFILADENGGLGAHKCLLVLNGTNNAPVLSIGETTNLVSIDNGQLTIDNDVWYTLDGRKLNGKPTKKGLYIHNGRKVVIK